LVIPFHYIVFSHRRISSVQFQDIRNAVNEIEQTAREILTVLQSIHQEEGFKASMFNNLFLTSEAAL